MDWVVESIFQSGLESKLCNRHGFCVTRLCMITPQKLTRRLEMVS